jgi:histidinol dehydrogenase
VSQSEILAAQEYLSPGLVAAIDYTVKRIYDFHLSTVPKATSYESGDGMVVTRRIEPLKIVGLYSPRGTKGYPSSVMMTACAAKAAGVEEIVLCTPPGPDGWVSPSTLYAAKVAGVSRVFRIGGAVAIAAMAFGTDKVPRVDKIAGPGNEYASAAKRLLYGIVGIDMVAGPSEVAVIAGERAPAEVVAADLLAQAEHGKNSWSTLFSESSGLLDRVATLLESTSVTGDVTAVQTKSLQEAGELASLLAPEHLEVFVENPSALLPYVRNCGAIFVGPYSGAPLGDYSLGPNHVLPTAGSGRFSSGLSALDFVRITNIVDLVSPPPAELLSASRMLAEAEEFPLHARAISLRPVKGCD